MAETSVTQYNLKDIILDDIIGRGTATVYNGTLAGKCIAVKKMDCNTKREVPPEVKIHSSLPPHSNILSLFGVAHAKHGFTVYICMELADTSLYTFLHTNKQKPTIQRSTKWALQIAKAMQHIHQHGFAHRDLKSANVLLFNDNDIVKVCDFGSAKVLEVTATATGMTGTYRWMAPEFDDKETAKVSQRCDIFSYGMVVYEMFAHKIPLFNIRDDVEAAKSIRKGLRPEIPDELPLHIQAIMQSCWRHNSHARPTFHGIIKVLNIVPASAEEAHDILSEKSALHKAAEEGNIDTILLLIQDNSCVHSKMVDGKTALHIAASCGHVKAVEILIEAHIPVNVTDKDGTTPLYLASERGHTECVGVLMKNGGDPTQITMDGISTLYVTTEGGNVDIVDMLLKGGADPNVATKRGGFVPLCVAAQKGHTEVTAKLVMYGAIINQQDTNGSSPLHFASRHSHLEEVKLLLLHHADVNICDKYGCSPLYIASSQGHTIVVDCLLKAGADPNLANTVLQFTPLIIAAQEGHVQTVARLIDDKANINRQDEHGQTALYLASYKGHLEVVQLLLQHKAKANILNVDGHSPLYCASQVGHTAVVNSLLDNGGDPNLTTINECSVPLGVAAQEGYPETVERLLHGNANVDHQDNSGQTPLFFASRNGHMGVVKVLLQHNAKTRIHDKSGDTAMDVAMAAGHTDIFNLLRRSN